MSRGTQVPASSPVSFRLRGYHTLWPGFPADSPNLRIGNSTVAGPTTPRFKEPGFRLFRFRSPLLSESRLIFVPPGTEMVHFPGLARTRLWIQRAVSRVQREGFPHSDIPGSKPAYGSPRLIAACHVLRRLLAPRHPPHALSSLTIKLAQHVCALPLAKREAEQDLPGKFTVPGASLALELAVFCQLPSVVKEPEPSFDC